MTAEADSGDETVPAPTSETGDPGSLAPRAAAAPGGTMGRFVVIGVLGAGGMGVVLQAFDPELDRKVAIKVLHSGGSGVEARARLQREAQAMAKLSHPNAVTVYEVGRAGEHLFIAMELVEGTTLKAWLGAATRTWREVLDMYVATGRGLEAAHQAGLVHRDFKPENVLIGKDGRPRVSDFGLAESGGADPDVIVGTPTYMAPEQWLGEEIDARTDQFAFCVSLWIALYKQPPFEGFTPQEIRAAVTAGRRRSIEGNERGVPGWLGSVLARGLATEPSARWPSMSALLAEIERRVSRRRRAWLAAGGLALVVASGGAAVAAMGARETAVAPPCPVPSARLETVWGPARAASLRTHLATIDPHNGAARYTAAAAVFDRGAPAWRDMQVATCRANKIENRQSDTIFDARMKCLDGWLDSLGAAVKTVEAATDAASLEGAIKAATGVGTVDRCADVDALLAAERLPDDPTQRAEAKAILAEVGVVNADRKAGEFDGLVARSDALIARARKLGHPATLAKALGLRWRISVSSGDVSGSLPFLRELTEVAARGGNDHEAANTWAFMGRLTAQWLGQPDEARIMLLAARAASARAGDPLELRVEVLGNEADVLTADGDTAGALVDLDEARVLLVKAGAEQPGSTLAPRLGGILQGFGEAHLHEKHYDEAIAAFHHAIAIFDRAFGPDTGEAAGVYLDLAQALLRANRLPEAEAAVDQCLRFRSGRNPEAADTAIALSVKADIVGAAGRHDESIETARRSVDIAHATMPPDDGELLAIQATYAGRLVDAGKNAEAIAVLDEILSIADKADMETDNVRIWRELREMAKQNLAKVR